MDSGHYTYLSRPATTATKKIIIIKKKHYISIIKKQDHPEKSY